MTLSVHLVLMIAAVVCLFCAAIGIPSSRVALGWLGVFFYVLTHLITR